MAAHSEEPVECKLRGAEGRILKKKKMMSGHM